MDLARRGQGAAFWYADDSDWKLDRPVKLG